MTNSIRLLIRPTSQSQETTIVSQCISNTEESAEELLLSNGFLLIVKGDNNIVNMGTIILRYSTILGMTGLKLIIGQLPGLGAGVSRTANNCRIDIGNRVVINGVTLYLQEDDSYVSIGDDSQLSWGIDIWCTDAHTITDLKVNRSILPSA